MSVHHVVLVSTPSRYQAKLLVKTEFFPRPTQNCRGVSDTEKVYGIWKTWAEPFHPSWSFRNLVWTSSRSNLNHTVLRRSSCSRTRPRFCVGYKAVRFQTHCTRAYLKKKRCSLTSLVRRCVRTCYLIKTLCVGLRPHDGLGFEKKRREKKNPHNFDQS